MLAAGVAAVAAIALVGAPAVAHTELRGSDPEEGATVDTLDQVRLEFSSALLDIGAELVLIDGDGVEHELTPEFPEGEHAVIAAVDSAIVAAGATVLDWRIVAEDGHPIEGEINFTFDPVVEDEPAPEQTPEAVETDEESVEPAPEEEPEPVVETTPITTEPETEEVESGGNAVWAWVLIGLAVVGLAVTAIAMSRKRDQE